MSHRWVNNLKGPMNSIISIHTTNLLTWLKLQHRFCRCLMISFVICGSSRLPLLWRLQERITEKDLAPGEVWAGEWYCSLVRHRFNKKIYEKWEMKGNCRNDRKWHHPQSNPICWQFHKSSSNGPGDITIWPLQSRHFGNSSDHLPVGSMLVDETCILDKILIWWTCTLHCTCPYNPVYKYTYIIYIILYII